MITKSITGWSEADEDIALIRRLHVQFSHPPAERLEKLLRQAKYPSRVIGKIKFLRCTICREKTQEPSRPIVAFPDATDFNRVLQVDLLIYGKEKTPIPLFALPDPLAAEPQEVLSSLVRHGTVSSSYLIAYGLFQHQNAIS